MDEFAEREGLMPFIKVKGRGPRESGFGAHAGAGVGTGASGYVIGAGIPKEEGMEDVGRRFQELYEEVEEQLEKRRWKGGKGRAKAFGLVRHLNGSSISSSAESGSGSGDERGEKESVKDEGTDTEKESEVDEKVEKEERREDERSMRIREVLEAVERTLCCVFYDR